MKFKTILGIILRIPLFLIVFGSFGASIYAAYYKVAGITYASSVVIGVSIVLYFIGSYISRKKDETKSKETAK